jgi:glutathione S-transferase
MSSTIIVPKGFAYTGAAVLSTAFVLLWQTSIVGGARKRAGIKYPQAYAEKAEAAASKEAFVFNCAQRAHQNTLEAIPFVLITTLITALKYPVPAAAACGLWSFSRIIYTLGYTTGEPKKRTRGNVGFISLIGLLGGATYTVYGLLMAGI